MKTGFCAVCCRVPAFRSVAMRMTPAITVTLKTCGHCAWRIKRTNRRLAMVIT